MSAPRAALPAQHAPVRAEGAAGRRLRAGPGAGRAAGAAGAGVPGGAGGRAGAAARDAARAGGPGGAGRRPRGVPLRHGHAAHLRGRRAPQRHHAHAGHAGRAPRGALRRGDAHHPARAGHAPGLVQVGPREAAAGRGGRDGRGAGRGHAGLHPGGHRQARRAGARAVQQGPLHAQVVRVPVAPLPQLQVPADGARRPRLGALHDHAQGHHRGLRPQQLPRLPHQVEQGHRGHVRAVHGGGPRQVPARLLRAAGAAPPPLAAPHPRLPGHRLERHRPAPRGPHRQARGRLPVQDRALHGPGHQAREPGSPVQVDRPHPRGRGEGHGPDRPHVGSARLRPLCKPPQLRQPRPHRGQQYTPGLERGLQNTSQSERIFSGEPEQHLSSPRKLVISRSLQTAWSPREEETLHSSGNQTSNPSILLALNCCNGTVPGECLCICLQKLIRWKTDPGNTLLEGTELKSVQRSQASARLVFSIFFLPRKNFFFF